MSFISVFDVLGPNMIGPSSSHTAGASGVVPGLLLALQEEYAMYAVGRKIPMELRETALGGCAITPSGCAMCQRG